MSAWLWLVGAASAGIAAAPFLRERRRPIMDAQARRAAPGEFAPLPLGETHYRWAGQARGPVAVCVHGLTTPSFVWEALLPELARLGFRVLVYDLYGRGFSDRPAGRQDAAFFTGQLDALLAAMLEEDEAITLIGYSMGGAIATAYAARRPERLRSLVLIAPAGMGHDLGPLARFARGAPLFGDWLFLAGYPRQLRRGIAEEAAAGRESAVPDMAERQAAELRWRGFLPAVKASLRGILARPMEAEHRAISRAGVPVLAIWGREDPVIPLSGLGRLVQWNRVARQEVVEGAGHGLVHTHPAEVAEAMRDFVEDPPG